MAVVFFLTVLSAFLVLPAHADTKIIISEAIYIMGDGETPSGAEAMALQKAKQMALEQAGTYVESYSKVQNYQLTAEEIQTIAGGIMQVEVLDKKRELVGDGLHHYVKIKATVTTDMIADLAQRINGTNVVREYKKLQEDYLRLSKEIDTWKQLVSKASPGPERDKALEQIREREKDVALVQSDETALLKRLEPISITGVQEPNEMRVEPFPVSIPSAQERMLIEAMASAGNNNDPAAQIHILDRILAQYPDYSDGYAMRLALLCEGNNRVAVLSDINNALKYIKNSRIDVYSSSALLSMRAKVEHTIGKDNAALEDLDKAIRSNLDNAINFAHSDGVAPQKTASICIWTESDLDELARRFPNDYRPLMARGLYYGFFTRFGKEKAKTELLHRAFINLDKVAKIIPRSALPHYFKARIFYSASLFTIIDSNDPQHDKLNNTILDLLNKALEIDPNMIEALAERAAIYRHLKKWKEAVADYDRVLQFKPNDRIALNDRGTAKMQMGRVYDAISDFSEAIRNTERKLQETTSLENRADAYMKTQQWDLAIRDLTTAISLQIGGATLLIHINQFRALYPEYKSATDEAITRKLNKTFYPNMHYESFSKIFLQNNLENNKFFESPVLSDLFEKRSATYLKSGNLRRAAIEFRRVVNGFPTFAGSIERWGEVGLGRNSHVDIDLSTFDDSGNGSVKFWVRIQNQENSKTKGSSLQNYELNCAANQIRTISVVTYNDSGELIGRYQGGEWESIAPDSFGEAYFNGICRSN